MFVAIPATLGSAAILWYGYQVASRKQTRVRYKLNRIAVGMPVYLIATVFLRNGHGFTDLEVAIMSALMAMGAVWLLVNPAKQSRYIPKSVRRVVIERDLGIKPEQMDSSKYHLDHGVPFSKGGDNSVRNLRVKSKADNLKKGNKWPSPWEFLGKS